MKMPRFLIAALAAAVLSSCAGPENLPPLEKTGAITDNYRLDSGDQLRITVFNQEQLTGLYAVDPAGDISMPLIGQVPARGLTPGDLEKSLVKRLSQDQSILVNPSINVQVQTYRPFYILGEVKNPGQYPWAHESTVLSAVAVAGGFTYRARQDYVSITRKNGDQVVEGRGDRSSLIEPGDVVYVFERYF
jgi:polysaccharide export outer membrane protein